MSEGQDRAAAVARASTRGVAVIAIAKAYFMLTGFAQPIVLTRLLGQSGYGVYGSVLNAVSILNNVVVAGSIQAMSRSVTASGVSAVRRGLALHVVLGVALAGTFAALAEPIGVGLLGDPQLPPLLRIAAIVVGNYSVYAALVGALNGQQRFVGQAGLDMTFATLRTALVLGLAATAMRVTGAVAGFAAASGIILAVALVLVMRGVRAGAPPALAQVPGSEDAGRGYREAPAVASGEPFGQFVSRYVRFFAPVLVYQLALNLVLQADLLVLKGLLVRRGEASLERVNELVGIYKSVQNFAFLPYQLLLAVTFVAFPIVSRATLEGDRETGQRFVRNALRFSALALGGMLAVLVGLPVGVLRLAYRPEVAVGAGALRTLSLGQGAFALAVISATIVLAAGRTLAATLLMCAMLAAVFAGDYVGITLAPFGVASLDAAAAGTAAGCALGMVAMGVYVRRMFGAFVPAATLARTAAATAGAAVAVGLVPLGGKVVTLGLAMVAVALYVVLLVVLGEIGPSERAAVRSAVARRLGKRGSPA